MEAHLDGCPPCVVQLDALTPSLSEDLWEAVREPVAATPGWADQLLRLGGRRRAARSPPTTACCSSSGRANTSPMGRSQLAAWARSTGPGRSGSIAGWPSRSPRVAGALRTLIARFLEEAPRQAQLEHPNIVRVYARDEQDGVPYFSMELVNGETLARASRGKPFAPRHAAQLMCQIASAVHYAHNTGVFHRDLKPGNIMLTVDGVPKILDFGLARTLDEPSGQASGQGRRDRRVHGPRAVGG